MSSARIQWLGHKQHFIGSDSCRFSMATLVNDKFVVSTVGEYYPATEDRDGEPTEIGWGRKFETYVFRALKKRNACGCPAIKSYSEIDSRGYNDAKAATVGHMDMVKKWARAKKAPK